MPKARLTDPKTSHLAAESVENVSETKKIILTWLATNYGLTDVALVKAYNGLNKARRSSESGIRSRRAELVAAGLVVDTGDRVKLPSNRLAIVWAVA